MSTKKLLLMFAIVLSMMQMVVAGPLHDAVQEGDLSKVKDVLSKDAKIAEEDLVVALMLASKKDENIEIVEFLLSKGAKINAQDRYGITTLMRAANNGCQKIVKLLLSKGADVGVQDEDKKTALHFDSQYKSDTKIIKNLLLLYADKKTLQDLKPVFFKFYKDILNPHLESFIEWTKKGSNPKDLSTEQIAEFAKIALAMQCCTNEFSILFKLLNDTQKEDLINLVAAKKTIPNQDNLILLTSYYVQRLDTKAAREFLNYTQPSKDVSKKALKSIIQTPIFTDKNLNAVEHIYLFAKAKELKKVGTYILDFMTVLSQIKKEDITKLSISYLSPEDISKMAKAIIPKTVK